MIIFLHDFNSKTLIFYFLISRTGLLMGFVLQHFVSLQVTRSHVAAAKCLGNHAGDHRGSRRFHLAPPSSQRCSCYEAGGADQQNERYIPPKKSFDSNRNVQRKSMRCGSTSEMTDARSPRAFSTMNKSSLMRWLTRNSFSLHAKVSTCEPPRSSSTRTSSSGTSGSTTSDTSG